MSWNPDLPLIPIEELQTIADRYTGDCYTSRGRQLIEESAFAIIDKLKELPAGMAEPFARSFAKGAETLLKKQDEKLANHMVLPLQLPAPLEESTDLRFRKGKRRAMTGLEAAEERERDLSRQRRHQEREAAALATVDKAVEEKGKERMEKCEWVAETQLRLGQLSQLSRLSSPEDELPRNEATDNEIILPTRSRPIRACRPSTKQESQEWQIAHGLIEDPKARAKEKALNRKKQKAMLNLG
jgi:hypothetical protein